MLADRAQMRRIGVVVAFGAVLTGLALTGPAAPQGPVRPRVTPAAPTGPVTAFVDPSGTVVPAPASNGEVEMLGLGGSSTPNTDGAQAANTVCPKAPILTEDEARALVRKVAQEENFYPDFVFSVAQVESSFKSNALSEKGAFGLMQLMPTTGKTYNVDICDPKQNVLGGVRFLRNLHEKYKNPFFILAAYNAGEEKVQQAKGVPAIAETVRFVADVMNNFYEWPRIERERPPSKRVISRADRSPAVKEPENHGRWSSGFVMHLDRGAIEQEESQR